MMGWQWHQLDHMQIICTLLHTDNHASISPLSFLQAGCPSCRPANSVKALCKTHFTVPVSKQWHHHDVTVMGRHGGDFVCSLEVT